MMTLTIVENIVANGLRQRGSSGSGLRLDRASRVLFPAAYLLGLAAIRWVYLS
jgi:hypothetical protein